MNPGISIQERQDYLRFHIEGVDSYQFSIEYFSTIAEECRRRGYTKVLIIEELQGQLSTTEMFNLCEKLPSILKGLKTVLVDKELEHHSGNRFGETVAINRGAIGKVCGDEKEAEEWLFGP